ncbi:MULTISPECIES: ImmA/IrrE family metallo-endopeptidase [Bacteroides]|jgi:Zn-dependent peptidase ImmA (M78 family)|uniref:ImmA/IrrE family metallo-endopeptidase n=1 Tax=Bacteroides TaxID=816 RepID=UPI00202DDCCE|nr:MULTISPECIES: ImmA/IrrE family metallo-endopeptidase [Bacteroides]MCM0337367.1 ImmA/IrrE family metallo-endopeptidase [Bacteroides fragilis]MDA3619678.1 ImmA/IrrE family metallo-endopeptidase [Bacteroides sp. 47]
MIAKKNRLKIKKLAEYIALQFDEKITPLEKIVADENLDVFYDNYESNTFDGMTIYDNGKFYIHINTYNGNRADTDRGRFTLAHELGHYFIDTHRIGLKNGLLEPHPSLTNKAQYFSIEREADYFAACLLMPEERFRKDIGNKKFGIEVIDYLRAEYKISRTACALRFADIGNYPLLIVYAENNIIRWSYSSEDFPFKWMINDKIVPRNTVMGDYFNNNHIAEVFRTEQVWAIDCFKYVKDEDLQRKFYEHCITHKNSALSLFWED